MNNWQKIPGFEGYFINEYGIIKSTKRYPEGRIVSPYTDKDGYLCNSLRVNNRSKALKVHRAVGIVFITNPENLPQINHKDGNKRNNHHSNLEWSSNIHNQQHAWDNDLKTVKLTTSQVLEIKQLLKLNKTNTEIAQKYNVDPSTVSNIRNKKTWKNIQ